MKKLISFIAWFYLLVTQVALAADSYLSLTASDGSGLELRQFEARVVLDGFLAFTELEMTFYNPEKRRREGRFQIVLPDNAAISRFAMKIGEQLQEGEVVEKQLARRAYEDFLHRRQDPALLEIDSGNRFNARIFPIEPQAEKQLILSYSQRLTTDYVLPLKGLPLLKRLSIKAFYDNDTFNRETTQLGALTATKSKRDLLTVDKQDYQPTEDFRMPYQPKSSTMKTGGEGLAMYSEQLVAAKFMPFPETTSAASQPIETLVILVDTSASQAPFLAESIKRLENLLPQLKAGNLLLYTFDQVVKNVGTASNLKAQLELMQQLEQYQALGASRFDAAFATLKELKLAKARLLLVSDGVVTAGETSANALATLLKAIPWLDRIDVLIPSYHSDKQIARSLVKAGKVAGMIASWQLEDAQLLRKLTSPVYADIPITVAGASWSWPDKVEALQANEPLILFAEMPSRTSATPDGTVNIKVAGKSLSLTTQVANPILLKREWVRARIDRLLDLEDNTQDKDLTSAYHNEIINLSVKERVLSPYTSLLVLETENDYRRFNIDRKGLADILTVGMEGITVIKRGGIEVSLPPPMTVRPLPPIAMAKTRPRPSNGDSPAAKTPVLPPEPAKPVVPIFDETKWETKPQSDGTRSEADSKDKGKEQEAEKLVGEKKADLNEAVKQERAASTESTTTGSSVSNQPGRLEDKQRAAERTGRDSQADKSATMDEGFASSETSVIVTIHAPGGPPASPALSIAREVPIESAPASRIAPAIAPSESSASARMRTAPVRGTTRPLSSTSEDDASPSVEVNDYVPPQASSWVGHYAEFRALLEKGDLKAAGQFAQEWRQADLSNVIALITLGEWYAQSGDTNQAARAYGSLIDYFPARADIRRWAAERLLVLKSENWLSVDSLKQAVAQRPDHPSGHYLLAIAYWEAGQAKEAVETLQAALQREFDARFSQAKRILGETLALMLTTLDKRQQLETLFPGNSVEWEKVTQPQLRFVLMWETDANDVDFHIYDKRQNHAFYSQPNLRTGGSLYADITTGYGPECFTIPQPTAFPYRIQANYYSMGPMGYGMGLVHILHYDVTQGLRSEFRPFVVMQNGATVDLGEVKPEILKAPLAQ
jgi:cytochrome c-type biogenesis protein CcmH/NrfG